MERLLRVTALPLAVWLAGCQCGGPVAGECPAGQARCGSACVDLNQDRANCGACGTTCAPGVACSSGQCSGVDRCEASMCSGGTHCDPATGLCVCSAGLTACGNACVDLQSSNAHCGRCDRACSGQCSNGTCPGGGCADGVTFAGLTPAVFPRHQALYHATGDLDGDGKLDLVVSTGEQLEGDGRTYVLHGKGGFRFGEPQRLDTTGVEHLTIADLDGDGRNDIIAAATGPSSSMVRRFLNRGDGGFLIVDTPTGPQPGTLALGDVDGDGRLDVAVAILNTQSFPPNTRVQIHLGQADGGLSGPEIVGAAQVDGLLLEDLDGDGRPELVVSDFTKSGTDSIDVHRRTDAGQFKLVQSIPVTWPGEIVARDWNGDGLKDLAVATRYARGDAGVFLLFNQPAAPGTFEPPTLLKSKAQVSSLVAADFDGDGRADLAARGGFFQAKVVVFLSRADGGFSEPLPVGAGSGQAELSVGDHTGDGKPDLTCISGDAVAVLVGEGDGGFVQPRSLATSAEPLVIAALADAGALAVATRLGRLEVYPRTGPATFGAPATATIPIDARGLTWGSFGGPGTSELAVSFGRSFIHYAPQGQAWVDAGAVVAGDSFNEGLQSIDIAGTGRDALAMSTGYLPNGMAMVFPGASAPWQEYGLTPGPTGLASGDVDGDGHPDLAVACSQYETIEVLRNKGDGGFTRFVQVDTDAGIAAVAVGDVDGDGRADVVGAGGRFIGELSVLRGKGGGMLAPPQLFPITQDAHALALGDLDGDGRADAVTAHSAGSSVAVALAQADGGFGAPQVFALGPGVDTQSLKIGGASNALRLADVDGDGRLDVLVASPGDDRVYLLTGAACR
ncbi:MAG: FG-GAP-like repeat-containing protein [Myxococcaceae bacterium]|nr:FG-GAP-like repeat-containing protein [Myxococcaceae bacterium]